MIPVPGLRDVKAEWITIKARGYQLHGFLLYTASDHFFPEYINGDGLGDLEIWSGKNCAIFIVHSPSEQWIEYTRKTDHVWWKVFGKYISNNAAIVNTIRNYGNEPVLQIGGTLKTLHELFEPPLNLHLYGEEIRRILEYFDLGETQHPCLILFKDIEDRTVWYIDLSDLVNIAQADLRTSLKQWFAGKEFKKLMQEAGNA